MKENGHTHEKEGSRGDAEGAEGEESEPRKTQKNTEEDISVNSVPTFIHPVAQPPRSLRRFANRPYFNRMLSPSGDKILFCRQCALPG